ncbi:MAG: hypothetical protein IKR09_00640 [Alphaproteobacteria bacterium]|nr:hypothetical protein [Alphaproteobacteria bacterium]
MKKIFMFVLTFFVLMLSACRNQYEIPTYVHTDTYNSLFEGRHVPRDVR